MSVTVDHEDLNVEQMGFQTIGQVLNHLQRDNRLVVNLLIDGARPDLSRLSAIRASALSGRTLFIETVEPREIALDVLGDVDTELDRAEQLQSEVIDQLQLGMPAPAMERLSGCFSIWNMARESLEKTAQLLRINLEAVRLDDGCTLADSLSEFAGQLRQIKTALEDRDFVSLSDLLTYEMTQTTQRWREAISVVRHTVPAPQAA